VLYPEPEFMGIEAHRRDSIIKDVDDISGESVLLQVGKSRLDVVDAIRGRLLDHRRDRWSREHKNRCKAGIGRSAGDLYSNEVDGSGCPQEKARQQKEN